MANTKANKVPFSTPDCDSIPLVESALVEEVMTKRTVARKAQGTSATPLVGATGERFGFIARQR